MKTKTLSGKILKTKTDLLVFFLFETEKISGPLAAADGLLNGALSAAFKKEFKGKESSSLVINSLGKLPAKKIALVGLGKKSEFTDDKIRLAGANLVKVAQRTRSVVISAVFRQFSKMKEEDSSRLLTEGAFLANYEFSGFKTVKEKDEKPEKISEIALLVSAPDLAAYKKGATTGAIIAGAVNQARTLINTPANKMTPADFVNFARKLFKGSKVKMTVLEKSDLKKMGMGAILAVAQGSVQPPKMLVLKYSGAGAKNKTLGLVGKGITFDSGGISIKPSRNMSEMKDDMSGAAAVCLATRALADLKTPVNLLSVIPLTENMPSGGALKPSDVVTAFNKKTVEIISTDAEGRLILADALSYAVSRGAGYLVDVATLTGGCVAALGDIYAGAVSNDKKFQEKVLDAAASAGEKIWPFPFDKAYQEFLKSDVADLKNCPEDGKASTINGGLFLHEFVKDVPWVHLDIAGTASLTREIGYLQKNATGSGTRTLIYLALNNRF